ncbi:MAG: dihydrodipicolinate synthase family protein [Planctomycetia bacterium]|nr:dihydrodipicolinate synthase family protein [Planctomycetia bacterium]
MAQRLTGVLPIVHTPFTAADEIDRAALAREIEFIIAAGSQGYGTGMVSELLRLTADERLRYTELLVELAAKRVAVFVSVGAESTKQAVLFAAHAERSGCDAVMAVPPLATRLGKDALAAYYCALADAISLPIIVQDASGYVGQAIPLAVYELLLARYGEEKILFKPEASPIGPNLSALRDATGGRARIFEGSGGIHLVDSYRRGIAGTMPGVDLLDGIVALWRALERGDEAATYRLYFPICAIVALQLQAGLDGFLAIEKYLLVKRGLFADARRRTPHAWELDSETAAEVDRLFQLLQAALPAERIGA